MRCVGGYEGLFKDAKRGLIELACWSHARRYFHKALKVGERQAWVVMELIGLLFKIERRANELNRGGGVGRTFTGQATRPVLEELAEVAGEDLGWDAARRRREVEEALAAVRVPEAVRAS